MVCCDVGVAGEIKLSTVQIGGRSTCLDSLINHEPVGSKGSGLEVVTCAYECKCRRRSVKVVFNCKSYRCKVGEYRRKLLHSDLERVR